MISESERRKLLQELTDPGTSFERLQEISEIAREYRKATEPTEVTDEAPDFSAMTDEELSVYLTSPEVDSELKNSVARYVILRTMEESPGLSSNQEE